MTTLIGIAGGSGSGKTTLAHALVADLGRQAQIVSLDAYYRSRKGMSVEEKARINYDHPEAFDVPLLVQHLAALRGGEGVAQPIYDYALHERSAETKPCPATPVVVLEGILVLALEPILPLLDLAVFVDTPADLRLMRRVRRDVSSRGRSAASVLKQYEATVRPMHRAFIRPSQRHADLIIEGEGDTHRALEVLRAWIRARS